MARFVYGLDKLMGGGFYILCTSKGFYIGAADDGPVGMAAHAVKAFFIVDAKTNQNRVF